ncbi:putative flavin-binding monooxygenase [Microdochium bolleyi]|uniref:Putative flavin-binding monooxygenase n=1 Tax=Microdochium bolleyi TaxID=196109 RepID=A0A136ILS2_9PEZI|nr:putative flavin-binding monooxygenase [Microdochium bolleyi]
MDKAVRDAGIEDHIHFHHKVVAADWDTKAACWHVTTSTPEGNKTFSARFLIVGTGYYNYNEPLATTIPGIDSFSGRVVHPQFWPDDLDYTGKNVVIIGSGATAITLLPSMVEKGAGHVTMLQRSPSYLLPLPTKDRASAVLNSLLPVSWASNILRFYNTFRTYLLYTLCKAFPKRAIAVLRKITEKLLPEGVSYDPHFKPRYDPWDQRLCVSPGGDFFQALRKGKGSVVTDTIEQVTADSIRLTSGQELHPDIIVTATGLKICFAGNIAFSVDGGPTIDPSKKYVWKAAMIQDLPNLFYMLGYTNASWTLGADVAATLIIRMLTRMAAQGKKYAVPRLTESEAAKMQTKSMFDLSSTYLKKANRELPKAGTGQWEPRTHYFKDLYRVKWGDLDSGLEMR